MDSIRQFMNKGGIAFFITIFISYFVLCSMCFCTYVAISYYLCQRLLENPRTVVFTHPWDAYYVLAVILASVFTAKHIIDSFLEECKKERSILSALGAILTSLLSLFIIAVGGMLSILVILSAMGVAWGRVTVITVGCISICIAFVFTVHFFVHLLGLDARASVDKREVV